MITTVRNKMKRTRYGQTGCSLPTRDEKGKETRLNDRVNIFTCRTTDRATFVRRDSPFSDNTRWYIFILFGHALLVEIRS